MKNLLEETVPLVRDWHLKFKLSPPLQESHINDFIEMRRKLFEEEKDEYFDEEENLVARADAIGDMLYILSGTLELLGRTQITLRNKILENLGPYNDYCQELIDQLLQEPKNSLIKEKILDIFLEINRSNHSKAGENGEPIFNGVNCDRDPRKPVGKIMKGPNYFEPNLRKVLFYLED